MRALLCLFVVVTASSCTAPTGPAPLWSADPRADNPLPDERSEDERGIVTSPDALRRFLPKGVDTNPTDALLTGWSSQLHDAGGWGVFAPVLLRFAAPVDDADASALAFVRLDGPMDPVSARVTWHQDPGVLEVQPLSPVAAHARIGVVVLRSLVKGQQLARTDAFDAYARGAGKNDVDAAARALSVSPDDIALVSAYRTADNTADLLRAKDLVADLVPAFTFDDAGDGRHGVFTPANAPTSLTNHPDELQARLAGAGLVAVGVYTSKDVRDASTRVFSSAVLSGAAPALDNDVEVVLVEPDASKFPPPWPAVILQHGFQGSNAFVVDNAAPFLKRGLAVLGIDAVSSGRRGSVTTFFNLSDPRTIRDNFRQTVVDQLVLANLAAKADIDVDGVAGSDLDGTVAYYGHSMGAVLGSTFAMVSEGTDVVAVNAPGGGLCDVFRSSGLEDLLQLLVRPLLGIGIDDPSYADAFPILTAIAQPLLEGADPIAYARTSSRPHMLLQLDVGDELVPNGSTRDLAQALDAPTRAATVAMTSASGQDALVELTPAAFEFPADQNPHGMFDVVGIQAQAAQFIATRGHDLVAARGP